VRRAGARYFDANRKRAGRIDDPSDNLAVQGGDAEVIPKRSPNHVAAGMGSTELKWEFQARSNDVHCHAALHKDQTGGTEKNGGIPSKKQTPFLSFSCVILGECGVTVNAAAT
jgi:hypothetical protein